MSQMSLPSQKAISFNNPLQINPTSFESLLCSEKPAAVTQQTRDTADSWQDSPVLIIIAIASELTFGSLTGGHLVLLSICEG